MTKKVKSIAFNTKNELDNDILKHVTRRNFSGYVKRLIAADIEKRKNEKLNKSTQKPIEQQPKNPPINRRVKSSGSTKPTQPAVPRLFPK